MFMGFFSLVRLGSASFWNGPTVSLDRTESQAILRHPQTPVVGLAAGRLGPSTPGESYASRGFALCGCKRARREALPCHTVRTKRGGTRSQSATQTPQRAYSIRDSICDALGDYRQWPVPQTVAAPAAAPIALHSMLRRKRRQNVPPLAAAARSRVIAASFAASSALFCFAVAS